MRKVAWGSILCVTALPWLMACGSAGDDDGNGSAVHLRRLTVSSVDVGQVLADVHGTFGVSVADEAQRLSEIDSEAGSWLFGWRSQPPSKFALRGLAQVAERNPVRVVVPESLERAFSLRERFSGVGISVRMDGVEAWKGRTKGRVTVYSSGQGQGDLALVAVGADGLEDWLVRSRLGQDSVGRVSYQVEMNRRVAAVRFVGRTLEWLDERGVPRLRLSPPWVKDSAGRVRQAQLDVSGCDVIRSAAGPWGIHPKHSRARSCRLTVSWDQSELIPPILVDPAWTTTKNMGSSRYDHCAVRLQSGKILVTGGHGSAVRSSAELYDPLTNTWAATASMHEPRESHSCTLLSDGQVLVAGGYGLSGPVSSAELYDPGTGLWTTTGAMHDARTQHGAVRLVSNFVLVAGGKGASGALASAELYNPGARSWAVTGTMKGARFSHSLTGLPDGNVLAAGGESSQVLGTAEWYSQTLEMWTMAPPMASPRSGHAAIVMGNGKLLVAGGWNGGPLSSVEVYDPVKRTWGTTAAMHLARHRATLTSYGASYVLVAGGFNTGAYDTAELFDFNAGAWELAGKLNDGRGQHVAVALDDSHVMVAGGRAPSGPLSSVEVFSAQPNGHSCTQSGECDSHFCVDGVCCDSACNYTCMACSAALKGQGTDGKCEVVKNGLDPHNDCVPMGSGACQTPGVCNGSGTCSTSQGFQCSSTSCVDSHTQNNIGVCDANQQCVIQGTTDCSPYLCKVGTCLHDCLTGDDCLPSSNCVNTHCVQPGANGARCQGDTDCSSGYCVDGVCCDQACNGTCQACLAVKKVSGPDGICGPAKFGSPCGATTCSQNKVTGMLCNSAGACVSQSASCEPFSHCRDAKSCPVTCSTSSDCVAGRFCNHGSCDLPLAIGAPCHADDNCQTGFCVDGVCCSSSCGGGDPNDCKACSVATGSSQDGSCSSLNGTSCSGGVCSFGICKPVPDAGVDAALDAPLDSATQDTGADVALDVPVADVDPDVGPDVAGDVAIDGEPADSFQPDSALVDVVSDTTGGDTGGEGRDSGRRDARSDGPPSYMDTVDVGDSCTCTVGPGLRSEDSRGAVLFGLLASGLISLWRYRKTTRKRRPRV